MSNKKNPFEEIERLFDRMSKQFEDVDRIGNIEAALPGRLNVDLAEFEEAFEVTADLPGFDTEDIDVQLLDEYLHIRAEREREVEESEPDRYIRRERSEKSVDRRVRLPEPVIEDEVEASFKNGVLTVCLPKAETSEETHQIDID